MPPGKVYSSFADLLPPWWPPSVQNRVSLFFLYCASVPRRVSRRVSFSQSLLATRLDRGRYFLWFFFECRLPPVRVFAVCDSLVFLRPLPPVSLTPFFVLPSHTRCAPPVSSAAPLTPSLPLGLLSASPAACHFNCVPFFSCPPPVTPLLLSRPPPSPFSHLAVFRLSEVAFFHFYGFEPAFSPPHPWSACIPF